MYWSSSLIQRNTWTGKDEVKLLSPLEIALKYDTPLPLYSVVLATVQVKVTFVANFSKLTYSTSV